VAGEEPGSNPPPYPEGVLLLSELCTLRDAQLKEVEDTLKARETPLRKSSQNSYDDLVRLQNLHINLGAIAHERARISLNTQLTDLILKLEGPSKEITLSSEERRLCLAVLSRQAYQEFVALSPRKIPRLLPVLVPQPPATPSPRPTRHSTS